MSEKINSTQIGLKYYQKVSPFQPNNRLSAKQDLIVEYSDEFFNFYSSEEEDQENQEFVQKSKNKSKRNNSKKSKNQSTKSKIVKPQNNLNFPPPRPKNPIVKNFQFLEDKANLPLDPLLQKLRKKDVGINIAMGICNNSNLSTADSENISSYDISPLGNQQFQIQTTQLYKQINEKDSKITTLQIKNSEKYSILNTNENEEDRQLILK